MTLHLTGVTRYHERGCGGIGAAAAYADQPVQELAALYDLIMLNYLAIGHPVVSGALLSLDEHLGPAILQEQAASNGGRSHESYRWRGHQWALAIDAAAQVAVYRLDLVAGVGAPLSRTGDEVFALADSRADAVAAPLISVDAISVFIALCEAPANGGGTGKGAWPAGRDAASAAIATLEQLAVEAHPGSPECNPPLLLDRMAATDEVIYCPLAFGYVNFARRVVRRHSLRFASAPGDADAMARGTLGGAGIAVSACTPHPGSAPDRHARGQRGHSARRVLRPRRTARPRLRLDRSARQCPSARVLCGKRAGPGRRHAAATPRWLPDLAGPLRPNLHQSHTPRSDRQALLASWTRSGRRQMPREGRRPRE